MQAAAHTGAAAPDSFDMSALKAALGGRGGCQPPSHTVRDHAASEQHEGAERDEGAAAAGAEVGAASPVGSGDGGKDGRGGDDKAGEPARPPAAWRVEVPSDEKENLDPSTGQYHGASHTPPQRGARPSRQPFTERPVPPPSSGQNGAGNIPANADAPRRKGLRAVNPPRDAGKPSMMR